MFDTHLFAENFQQNVDLIHLDGSSFKTLHGELAISKALIGLLSAEWHPSCWLRFVNGFVKETQKQLAAVLPSRNNHNCNNTI